MKLGKGRYHTLLTELRVIDHYFISISFMWCFLCFYCTLLEIDTTMFCREIEFHVEVHFGGGILS
jgi:hypothetical protein